MQIQVKKKRKINQNSMKHSNSCFLLVEYFFLEKWQMGQPEKKFFLQTLGTTLEKMVSNGSYGILESLSFRKVESAVGEGGRRAGRCSFGCVFFFFFFELTFSQSNLGSDLSVGEWMCDFLS